eukprot:CAMPEP_0179092392 /NCGR_PEP_ID=MMETSP0796-20121207/42254_1 /TAXON_ID=73915 /ORGANISM="Pyrodinium bahamense, Strain pbaha01" /LENGTH=185 /DNA_ID=CAMNT_0020789997 /DNA_START=6 /DNA_END=559 /DNA_ORIENTATION=-
MGGLQRASARTGKAAASQSLVLSVSNKLTHVCYLKTSRSQTVYLASETVGVGGVQHVRPYLVVAACADADGHRRAPGTRRRARPEQLRLHRNAGLCGLAALIRDAPPDSHISGPDAEGHPPERRRDGTLAHDEVLPPQCVGVELQPQGVVTLESRSGKDEAGAWDVQTVQKAVVKVGPMRQWELL